MEAWSTVIAAGVPALITGIFAVYIKRFSKANSAQHGEVMRRQEEGQQESVMQRVETNSRLDDISERISDIREDVKEVREHYASAARVEEVGQRVDEIREDLKEVRRRQDDHLEWHANG